MVMAGSPFATKMGNIAHIQDLSSFNATVTHKRYPTGVVGLQMKHVAHKILRFCTQPRLISYEVQLEGYMLVVMSGLPGTGKSTIAKAFASKYAATYVRVDEIESAIRNTSTMQYIGPLGYIIAFAIARSNLGLGNSVVADSVNPVPESRQGWRNSAQASGSVCFDVEVVCSDEVEHRRRVETRLAEIPGHQHPTWAMARTTDYAPWKTDRLVIDTSLVSPDEAIAKMAMHVGLRP